MAIELISGIKPKNDGSFPLVDAEDVLMSDGRRLSEFNFSELNETVILEEQTLEGFVFNAIYGYMLDVNPAPFTAMIGEVYRVVWDGVSYKVVAEDASEESVLLGNGTPAGLSGNDEPFAIGWSSTGVTYFALTDTEPTAHTVEIYQMKTVTGLPGVTENDNGKILQVVDGGWQVVAVADSEVKTYVDGYITEALGGEY